MHRRIGFQLLVGLLVLAVAGAVGLYGYNLGVAHGLARAGAAAGALPPWGYGRPWGFGFFPFFPIFPFVFFILLWVFLGRALFWRGRRYGGFGCGYDHEAYPRRRGRTTHL